ncbi:MAG: hypothetical protein JW924_08065, partial [Fusobacteriaceae bacterium]|nr:hypothetical protein [Fusobacteriaceae bacterium]
KEENKKLLDYSEKLGANSFDEDVEGYDASTRDYKEEQQRKKNKVKKKKNLLEKTKDYAVEKGEKLGLYLNDSFEQIILGNYTDKVTVLGTTGQIGLGFIGLDLPADLRDITADIDNWEWSKSHVLQTGMDGLAIFPIVGSFKYADEGSQLLKNLDKADDIKDTSKAVGKTIKKVEIKVNNMSEFFKTEFGNSLKTGVSKTKKQIDGQSIYEVTTKTENKYLKKGDKFYLDGLHKDHIEVFDKQRKVKAVLNLDGTINISKTETALKEGRKIPK